MRITFLGHAGFCVETPDAIIVADPWLSPWGAFDSSWFQFPRNHHLAETVRQKLATPGKARFLYISHEHKDHLDAEFLHTVPTRDFTVVIPRFRRPYLQEFFAGYDCMRVVPCDHAETVSTPETTLTLYLDDSELNRDSALLVRSTGRTFFNLNDCRIIDALPGIARREGPLDVLACQFSGAGWHPTCYAYPREAYEAIAARKVQAKFEGVVHAVRALRPAVYLPSAGPPCFLDPALMHLNFEPVNIFPRAPKITAYLARRLPAVPTRSVELMPGDVLDAGTGLVVEAAAERVDDSNYEAYVRSYAASYAAFFADRKQRTAQLATSGAVLDRLRDALQHKVEQLTLHERIPTPLYFRLEDVAGQWIRVDFRARTVTYEPGINDVDHYTITAPLWAVARVLDGTMTWDDLSLSFRLGLSREPDIYNTLIQGFIRLEPEDMNWFCAKLLDIERRQERITVEADGRRYAINRYCPHQGGDLRNAWLEEERFLVCPRHQWHFDLEAGGRAVGNDGGIDAVCLEAE